MISTRTLGDVVEHIRLFSQDGTNVSVSALEDIKARPHYPHIAFRLNITKYLKDIPEIYKLTIIFKNLNDSKVEIDIVDEMLTINRPVYQNKMEGPKIVTSFLKGRSLQTYLMRMEVKDNDEKDKSINCSQYPNEHFKSFSDCDSRYVDATLIGLGLKNYVPIWTMKNFSNITTHFVTDILPKNSPSQGIKKETFQVLDLMSGRRRSDCKSPCLKTKVFVLEDIVMENTTAKEDVVMLTMVQGITRTKTRLIKFRPAGVLSIMGSGFGLWLGLNLPKILCGFYHFVLSKDGLSLFR